jgi:dodecin
MIKRSLRRKATWNEHTRKLKSSASLRPAFAKPTQNAVAKACQSLRHVDWFEVTEMRGLVEKDKVKEFQVTVKIGFRLEDQPA